jgi:putative membrane-bound dehydrogenase-like protein
MPMVFRYFLASLILLASSAFAQRGDKSGVRMDDVVPEKLIPPSPVLPVEEALKSFQLASGFVIEAVAAEPLVDKPVCLDFDSSGRMWVCEMRGYMPDIDGKGESVPEGRIVVLEDRDLDGKFDSRHVFLDRLLLPRALVVFEDGLLFMDEEHLCWVRRKGVHVLGEVEVVDAALLKNGNVEHKPNGLLPNLDNRYYLAKSNQRLRRVGAAWELEPTAFRGQWGIARDDFGRLYHNNNSTLLFGDLLAPNLLQGNSGVRMSYKDFVQLGSNQVWPARVTPAVNRAYMAKRHGFPNNTLDPQTYKLSSATSAAGMTVYRGTNFPKNWYGTAFATEPVSNLVKAISIKDVAGGLKGEHVMGEREFLASTDERFRPVNAYNAPDGSLYIVDMYHGIIQHRTYMTSYLRKQTLSRGLDQPGVGHGRIYRIRSRAGKVEPLRDLSGLRGLDLVKVLMHPNAWQREMAQRMLVERKDLESLPFLEKLAAAGAPLAKIHAIWTMEGMGALKAAHLAGAIRSGDASLQASALWASTRLTATELAKLEPVLITAEASSDSVLPYLTRALGPLGTAKAFARLGSLLKQHSKIPFVREALVSGLNDHEIEFVKTELAGSKDRQLLAWLEQGSRDADARKEAGSDLHGDELASFERGKSMFHGEAACFGCHGADGGGMENLGPPLDKSEWVIGKSEVLAKILLHGMTGPLSVAGIHYRPVADMPGLAMNPSMTDQHLADIATYIRQEWSNRAAPVDSNLIRQERETSHAREGRAWTADELLK